MMQQPRKAAYKRQMKEARTAPGFSVKTEGP